MTLKELAAKAAEVYKDNPKVEAVYIAGSISREWEDEHSDIELHVLWGEGPSEDDRRIPVERLNGKMISFYEYEDEEWSETYEMEQKKLEMSHFLTQTVVRKIQKVTREFQVDIEDQCIAASVHFGIPLYGEELLDGLKAKVLVYPEALSHSMIEAHSNLGPRWKHRHTLLEREDWLMFYSLMASTQEKVMGLLFGLNCMYVHHPAYKWQKQSLELMNIKPDQLKERLESVFLSSPAKGLKDLESVVEDLQILVDERKDT
ncbi:DUF4037 domain-containing protein [Halobacillus sp. A1]|uniref:DUF4037 domain-containing protein n=1 Tax=Halobacillus sp. A1 TaxID=2880262 RepID=UPI0020A62770|nr:DUF4037 domain-containing protein [Halobacillus sp. A1]MCP3030981.1 DUF4037 domain-containing protein [Halobacillus sp. A1]